MKKNIAKVFLFFVIFLITNCEGKELNESIAIYGEENNYDNDKNNNITLKVKQTIMEQESYYSSRENNNTINITRRFIDFYFYRFYFLDIDKINPNNPENLTFNFYFNITKPKNNDKNDSAEALISIKCSSEFRCYDIYLGEHDYISFDFDLLITKTGGVISFLLISMGFFSLFNGYIYFNVTSAFYSGYSIFLFFREFCQLMEINNNLNVLHSKSKSISTTVYIFSVLTGLAYGYISIKAKYLRYISFGFIEGLIFAKALYYLILLRLNENHEVYLGYLLIEILSCLCLIVVFTLFRNKYYIMTIVNVSLLSSYVIVYGFHILIGGIPFLPFLILSRMKYKDHTGKEHIYESLYDVLYEGDKIAYYFGAFWILVILGFYLNFSGYKLFIAKKKKNISTL